MYVYLLKYLHQKAILKKQNVYIKEKIDLF
jgi:hypothetical protein